ncbi:MAG: histidine kinase, partial [Saprospiraceae bacterium]
MGGTFLDIAGLNHSGSGNFTEAIYDIATDTEINSLTARSGGTSYLSKAKLNADISVNADMNQMKFTLKENNIKLNALEVDAVGWVQSQGDDVNLDLDFKAPSTQFKHLLSMIPGAYTKDFAGVKADGSFTMSGNAKGTLNEKSLPAFNVNLGVKNGSFQYPDLPMGIKDIQTDIRVASKNSNLDLMTVDIPSFHMLLGQNPFDATLKLRTPISDPDVDATLKGKIILAELAKAFPMEGVKSLTGIITADVKAKTKMSYIDKEQYDKVDMEGNILIENMDYVADGMPKVLVQNMKMNFTPQNVKLENLNVKAGKSDIQADGTLDNILAYFSPGKTMTGNLKVRSKLFDANEWLPEETTEDTAPTPTAEPVENAEVFDRFKFSLDAEMNKIVYEDYELVNSVAKGSFTPEEINLERLSTKMGKSDIAVDGKFTNIFGYLYDNEIIGGNINFKSNYLDLNELGGYEETATAETVTESAPPVAETEIISVPDFLNMKVNADIKEVLFTNIKLKNVKGLVSVADERASLTDVK